MALVRSGFIRSVNSKTRQLLALQSDTTVCQRAGVVFWEKDRKGAYKKERTVSNKELAVEGVKNIGKEVKIFWSETKDRFAADVNLDLQHGDYEYLWKFNDKQTIDSWIVTSDKDNNEGRSIAQFDLSKNKSGVFSGNIQTEKVKDGVYKKTGYCNIRSPSNMKSFQRKVPYNLNPFNCLVLRVRGDGRPYLINIGMHRFFDAMWNDQYNHVLFTRGGPYWQIAKIPLSKFFLSSKGRVQDKQKMIEPSHVSFFGITIADGHSGPFYLEIDYMALLYDENHSEDFAYEMYTADPAHVGT